MICPEGIFDASEPVFRHDPYPALARLRERTPVFYEPRHKKVFFLRYADIATALRSRAFGRSLSHVLSRDELGWPPPALRPAAFDRFEENHLLSSEPPKHTRLRGLVARAFTAKRVETLRTRIEEVTSQLLDAMIEQGTFDLVREFAEPLPVAVIAELLGVAPGEHANLRAWSGAIVKRYELDCSAADRQRAEDAVIAFGALLRSIVAARRAEPRDDLITALAHVVDGGDRLSEDELLGTCILLLNAGHEATVNGTTAAVLAFMRRRDVWQRIVAAAHDGDDATIARAVEEVLRFDTPLPLFERWVLEDTELGGTMLPRGTKVALVYASGNRDPAKFERPDELDVDRDPNPHLTFGLGTHFCLGAPLARLEMQVALRLLARRLPELRLVSDADEVEYGSGFVIRGITRLEMTAGPLAGLP